VSSSVARAKRLADGVRSAQTLAGIKHTHCAVLKLLRSLVSGKPVAESRPPVAFAAPPTSVVAEGVDDFNVTLNLIDANGLPVLDWSAAQQWVESIPGSQAQAAAWASCEQAWLENLRAALGSSYSLVVKDEVALLSSLEANVAVATIAFVAKMRQRIVRVLDGVAHVPEWGNDILVVFDEDDAYYRYVAHYYPEAGDFAASGGMFIHHGCGHFVTVKADLRAIEPVIAHELTHACLSHLPIPAWLNEGLAVNTEQRLCPPPSGAFSGSTSPHQMQSRHRKFWKSQEIQEFWSGKSFLRADEGNELSYDLARIMVSQFASNWERFRSFALEANGEDGGAAAARSHLGIELGRVACALLEQEPDPSFEPSPSTWSGAPERGAFHENAS
jgi:hypothetical protein